MSTGPERPSRDSDLLIPERGLPLELKATSSCLGCVGLLSTLLLLVTAPSIQVFGGWEDRGSLMFVVTNAVIVILMIVLIVAFLKRRRWAWRVAAVFFGLHLLQAVLYAGWVVYSWKFGAHGYRGAPLVLGLCLMYASVFGGIFWMILRARPSYELYCRAGTDSPETDASIDPDP